MILLKVSFSVSSHSVAKSGNKFYFNFFVAFVADFVCCWPRKKSTMKRAYNF